MKYIYNLLIIIIVLLSIAAGVAKIMQTPQEVEFLQSFGFNNLLITLFGIFQIIGGVLLSNKKARSYGAIITGGGLLTSSTLIFISGNIEFGMVSLLPVVLTGVIIHKTVKLDVTSN